MHNPCRRMQTVLIKWREMRYNALCRQDKVCQWNDTKQRKNGDEHRLSPTMSHRGKSVRIWTQLIIKVNQLMSTANVSTDKSIIQSFDWLIEEIARLMEFKLAHTWLWLRGSVSDPSHSRTRALVSVSCCQMQTIRKHACAILTKSKFAKNKIGFFSTFLFFWN